MGGPTFRFDQVKGLGVDFDPWGVAQGLVPPLGIQRNSIYSDRQLRLNTFEGNPETAAFHFHRVARAETLRKEIVRVALDELHFWQKAHSRGKKPTEDDGREGSQKVREYWKVVGGKHHSIADLKKHPWSAAFISYVMKKAGALPDFKRAQKHTTYFYHAKQARRQLYGSLFKAYPASGQGAVSPEVGDVIANERADKPRSYDNLKPEGVSHSDIVVSKGNGVIRVVGGNVSAGKHKGNKVVGTKNIVLDDAGFLQSVPYLRGDVTLSEKSPRYFSVMKIEARTTNLLRPGEKR